MFIEPTRRVFLGLEIAVAELVDHLRHNLEKHVRPFAGEADDVFFIAVNDIGFSVSRGRRLPHHFGCRQRYLCGAAVVLSIAVALSLASSFAFAPFLLCP